ncbi:MAG: lytic transglycosylase domain-containing protein, partial [Gemmatimonadota bacterium]
SRYGIPADLAASIYDIALSEGIEPSLAYRLVHVESRFTRRAVSHKGAVGLAQVMPRTAFGMDPALSYTDLFEPETNLRLGFRYLRAMLERYGGDMRLALLAYNRGPGTVDQIRRQGGDPANGYARAIMTGQ